MRGQWIINGVVLPFELKEEDVEGQQAQTSSASASTEVPRREAESGRGYPRYADDSAQRAHPSGTTSTTPSAQSSLVVQSPLVQLNIQVVGSDVTVRQQSPPSEDDEDSEYELVRS